MSWSYGHVAEDLYFGGYVWVQACPPAGSCNVAKGRCECVMTSMTSRERLPLFVQSEIAFTATFFSARSHTWQTRESVGRFYKGSKHMKLFSASLVLRWPDLTRNPKASSSGELLPCEEVFVEIKATNLTFSQNRFNLTLNGRLDMIGWLT